MGPVTGAAKSPSSKVISKKVVPKNKKIRLSSIVNIADFESAASQVLPAKSFACKQDVSFPQYLILTYFQSSKPEQTTSTQHDGTNPAGNPSTSDPAFCGP
jgi:hypothetical protein